MNNIINQQNAATNCHKQIVCQSATSTFLSFKNYEQTLIQCLITSQNIKRKFENIMLTGNQVFWKKFKVIIEKVMRQFLMQVCAKIFSQSEFFFTYGHDLRIRWKRNKLQGCLLMY